MANLTREQVEQKVKSARETGQRPDLSKVTLSWQDLSRADLSGVILKQADLTGTILNEANLSDADLYQANLMGAKLRGADLMGAKLYKANLEGAVLQKANLFGANLNDANLNGAFLKGAFLKGASLVGARLRGTNLSLANLSEAWLFQTILFRADLDKTDLTNARVGATVFADANLGGVTGLDTVLHDGSSVIDINTIFRSKNKIPVEFLRGAGVSEIIIEWQNRLHALSFIYVSYSDQDRSEVLKLLEHLKFLPETFVWSRQLLQAGTDVQKEVEKAVANATLVILFITTSFLNSDFVKNVELETILDRHQQEDVIVFPIIAKPCVWKAVEWLKPMSVRPRDEKPIWSGDSSDVDSRLAAIAEEISSIAQKVQ